MKKTILLIIITTISVIALAHEFWFQPQKFFYSIREVAHVRFMAGEGFKGENWSGNKEKINQLFHYTPAGNIIDMSSRISLQKGDSLLLPLQEEGTQMLIFNSKNSFISLEADKFNEYLKEDGLMNALEYRRQNKEETKQGTEHYQRSIKTILQVGYQLTNACTKPSSLPLDIIPEENPYAIPTGTRGLVKVRFRILFENKPVPGVLVKTWYYLPGNKTAQMDTFRTDKKGWITANRHPGPYMVSCVHIEHTPADKEAEWQSFWGSLSFEYSQFFAGNATRQ